MSSNRVTLKQCENSTNTKEESFKKGKHYSETERYSIIREMLKYNCTKQYSWELYTGEPEEREQLIRWMWKLGYANEIMQKQFTFVKDPAALSKQLKSETGIAQLPHHLKKQLKDTEMKAIALATMVDMAENEFNIPIKKSSTPSHFCNENEFSSHRPCQSLWIACYRQTGLASGIRERNGSKH